MANISSHVLNTSKGCPARAMKVALDILDKTTGTRPLCEGVTDDNGRVRFQAPSDRGFQEGIYCLRFDTKEYFKGNEQSLFPFIQVFFEVADSHENYHVPLLLSPFGYSTYRGS